ncbi:MAG: YceI family protein [Sphingobacteriales bacterium]|nr:MAG: YceI family protein [Sphingobacteriales bacterium]
MKYPLAHLVLLSIVLITISCAQAPDAPKATATEPQQTNSQTTSGQAVWSVDVQQSNVLWVGTKPTGRHNGSFNIKEGKAIVANGQLTGGNFIIDLSTITVLDEGMNEDSRAKLTNHLKDADFFEISQFPTSQFDITTVQPIAEGQATTQNNEPAPTHNITGNLTLKGITKSISFPATVSLSEAGLMAKANFNIDRSNWGITYRNDQSLGDRFIRPEVNISINLFAKP